MIISFTNHSDLAYFLTDRRFWITLFMLTLVLPLSFLRKLDSLKYTSIIALFAVVYLCIIVIYYYISPNYPSSPVEDIEYFTVSSSLFGHLPVFVFSFTCHQNVKFHYQKYFLSLLLFVDIFSL